MKYFAIFALVFGVSMAQAWEISGGPGVTLNIYSYKSSATDDTLLSIGSLGSVESTVGYDLGLNGLQFVVSPSVYHYFPSGGSPSTTGLILLGGGNFSFDPQIKDSFFVEAMAGIYRVSGGSSVTTSAFVWLVGAGKRFALTESVSYRPEVRYRVIGQTNYGMPTGLLEITPLMFSIFL